MTSSNCVARPRRTRSGGGEATGPRREHLDAGRARAPRSPDHRYSLRARTFFTPDIAFADAERHLPAIVRKRGGDNATVAEALRTLAAVGENVEIIDSDGYDAYRGTALARIERRDPDDWPILATAIALDCPVWTEDNDFFGTGVPTWTSDRVELYLKTKK